MKRQEKWFVFVAVPRPTPLVSHFLQHYARIGFTDIVLASNESCIVDSAHGLLGDFPNLHLHFEPLYQGVFDSSRDAAVLNALRTQFVNDRDSWSATADIDEFFEFPVPLAELHDVIESGANTIDGLFVDCVASDGSLSEVLADRPIYDQFPEHCRITKKLLKGNDRKVMLSRGFEALSRGHHSREYGRASTLMGRVLHYKWNSAVIEHLTERVRNKDLTGYRWAHESENLLKHVEQHGRLLFENYR